MPNVPLVWCYGYDPSPEERFISAEFPPRVQSTNRVPLPYRMGWGDCWANSQQEFMGLWYRPMQMGPLTLTRESAFLLEGSQCCSWAVQLRDGTGLPPVFQDLYGLMPSTGLRPTAPMVLPLKVTCQGTLGGGVTWLASLHGSINWRGLEADFKYRSGGLCQMNQPNPSWYSTPKEALVEVLRRLKPSLTVDQYCLEEGRTKEDFLDYLGVAFRLRVMHRVAALFGQELGVNTTPLPPTVTRGRRIRRRLG